MYQNILGFNTMPSFVVLTTWLLHTKFCIQLYGTTTTKENALIVYMQNFFLVTNRHYIGHYISTMH